MALPKIAFNTAEIKTYLPFALLSLAILLEVLLLAFYFPGKVFHLVDLRDKVTQLAASVKQVTTANEQLAAVDDGQLSSGLTIAGVALPDEKKVAGLISGLGEIATSSGVSIKTISFSPGRVSSGSAEKLPDAAVATDLSVGDGVKGVLVTMTLSSSLPQFLGYLEKLQVASQLLGVTGINYSLSGPTPGGEMGLVVYYLPTRSGRPTWQYIPAIEGTDLEVLAKLSPRDAFNLPGGAR